MIRITGDINYYYRTIKLSYPLPVYELCDTIITPDIPVLLRWGQLRLYELRWWRHEIYVCIWGFSCLDYPLEVSISWICLLSPYNGFVTSVYHIIWCLIHVRVCMLTIRFSTHAFDSNLSIHMCLSLHTTWHSSHHSLGTFWLPGICMSRFWSLKLVDSLGCWLELCSESVDYRQTVQSPFLPGLLLGSRVFLL